MTIRGLKVLFYLTCTCLSVNFTHASMICNDIFSKLELTHEVFIGHLQNSQDISERLGYPQEWSYRLIGGRSEENKNLAGLTANTYLVERPDGSKVILKHYHEEDSLNQDFRAYLHLRDVLFESMFFRVPNVERSVINSRILEIEYFEGQNFDDFLKVNTYNSNVSRVVEQYNISIAHLFSVLTLRKEVFNQRRVSSEKIAPLIWGSIDEAFIRILPPNVLVVKNSSSKTGFDLIIIDPE